MDEAVREFVESCDSVVLIGTILSDFNTGAFTSHLDPEKTIDIRHHRTHVGTKVYPNVEMKDVLTELTRRVTKRSQKPPLQPGSLGPVKGARQRSDYRGRALSPLGEFHQTERYTHY